MELRPKVSASWFGGVLGILNTFFIAVGISAVAPNDRFGAVMTITIIGSIPGGLCGFVVGAIAGSTERLPTWQRLVVLAPPALGTVGFLSMLFSMENFFFVSCIPTIVAVLILERRTRADADLPVPVARANPASVR